MTNEQVAAERTVIRNPAMDDPNAGIIVAAGDPIPVGVGIISNTPNKVDAAANYDEVDAADKATDPRRAFEGTRPLDPAAAARAEATQEIVDRVSANRSSWDEQTRAELNQTPVDAADAGVTPPTGASATEAGSTTSSTSDAKAPADMTVAELDAAYGDADGYPRSAAKADKVAFAQAQAA